MGHIKRGAVLYDRRPKRHRLDQLSERNLAHVTGIYEETTTGRRLVEVQDGTHTERERLPERALNNFVPAGWTWPVSRKPLYHLTRECGVDDAGDLAAGGRRD
jgi:hypothetical protein